MFDGWRERRRLKREIKLLNKSLFAIKESETRLEEWQKISTQLVELQEHLNLLEELRLIKQSMSLGIGVPQNKEDWWKMTEQKPFTGSFDEWERLNLKKLIKEERFKIIKRWVELLIPILSLLIALLALTRK